MGIPIYQRTVTGWLSLTGETPPPTSNMLVGAASYHAPLSSHQSWNQILEPQVGPMVIRRAYESEGTAIPTSWETSEASIDVGKRSTVLSIRPPIQDFINGNYDTRLRNYLRSIPDDGYPKFFGGWHEPDSKMRRGNYTRQQFLSAFQRLSDIVHEEQVPNLYTCVAFTGWLWDDPTQAAGDADLWWLEGGYDVVAVDTYGNAPAVMFDKVLEYTRSHNVPWAVAETGWTDAATKPAQILATGDYCAVQGSGGWPSAAFMCWFDSDVGFDPALSELAFTPTSSPEAIAAANQVCQAYYRDPRTVVLP